MLLPTLDTTDTAEHDRILTAFGGEDAYLEWLRTSVRDRVAAVELRVIDEDANQQRAAVVEDVATLLAT